MQFDLETTGLDSARDRIFLVAVRDPIGAIDVLEARGEDDERSATSSGGWSATIRAADPDVIENHNLHGFDLPFLERRARRLGVPLAARTAWPVGLRQRAAAARRHRPTKAAQQMRASSRPDAS